MTNLTITAANVAVVYPGFVDNGIASEAITAGQAVRMSTTTGKWEKANATTYAEAQVRGIALQSVAAGVGFQIMMLGDIELGDALSSLAYDANVYLSDTDGTLSDTTGTVVRLVGKVAPVLGESTPRKVLRVNCLPNQFSKGLRITHVTGAAAGDHTVSGISLGDRIVSVLHLSTAASIATAGDLTSEFSIDDTNTITNTTTDTTNDLLIVFWEDLT
jgi:hypothetical protein